jgi:transketolase
MRTQIIDKIYDLMHEDEKIFFLTADMGINMIEKFQETFPKRFINVGIAEQNLIGVSAGLANAGYKPYVYTISNFVITRCLEQIRNDIVLHDYPIVLLGTSTGYDNAPLGPTHHIIDDWGILKCLIGVDIYCPSSKEYASKVIDIVRKNNKAAYIRIPKGSPSIKNNYEDFIYLSNNSNENLLISYGTVSQHCLDLYNSKNNTSVLILNKLYPLQEKLLIDKVKKYNKIIIAEDHFPNSGLYGQFIELLYRNNVNTEVVSLSPDNYTLDVGNSSEFYLKKYNLTKQQILKNLT